jgi:imidazole glycerol-phosphate synthase subunit HisH
VTAPSVVVLDHGSGNLRSAQRALSRAGADVSVTADSRAVQECDGLVVPGVGAFAAVMRGLESVRGAEMIGRRLAGGRPVLGICVGMQVLFESGQERGETTTGLGEWPGVVDRLDASVLPHMGWNTVEVGAGSSLFTGVEEQRFYFVHSFAAKDWAMKHEHERRTPAVLSWSEHGERFLAAVENGPLSAVQFHPEKSGDAGATVLSNWVRSLKEQR